LGNCSLPELLLLFQTHLFLTGLCHKCTTVRRTRAASAATQVPAPPEEEDQQAPRRMRQVALPPGCRGSPSSTSGGVAICAASPDTEHMPWAVAATVP
jgi:hypothetical protein